MTRRILAVEPYYGGSHKAWLDGLVQHSQHEYTLLTLPARKWKWRMRGAAITLSDEFKQLYSGRKFDALLASDMLNLADFIALTRPNFSHCPAVIYIHENQISYPAHEKERVDYHYAITNLVSMAVSTEVVFNSDFNKQDFFRGIRELLSKMPGPLPTEEQLKSLEAKSRVIPPGIDFKSLKKSPKHSDEPPVILWNHRWDRDKQPDVFIDALKVLQQREHEFRIIICGEPFWKIPPAFQNAQELFGEKLLHFGYAKTRHDYANLLAKSDIVVSTAVQEFFGISIVEAVYAGAFPILPKRLNYPYLIPEEYHNVALYEDGRLVETLEAALAQAQRKALPQLSQWMGWYDWNSLIKQYDELFDKNNVV